jgi:hypothetical protein
MTAFELFKIIGKTSKSSVPILSAANQRFSQGFSHFWPIALEFCSAHAGLVHGACGVAFVHGVVRRLHFASRTEIESFFQLRRVVKTLGFCMFRFGSDPRPWRR